MKSDRTQLRTITFTKKLSKITFKDEKRVVAFEGCFDSKNRISMLMGVSYKFAFGLEIKGKVLDQHIVVDLEFLDDIDSAEYDIRKVSMKKKDILQAC